MEKGREYKEVGENMDDFYKDKRYHSPNRKDGNSEENYRDDGFYNEGAEKDYEELEDKWYGMVDEYRRNYPDLTDEDVEVRPDGFGQTLERIGHRRGRTAQDIQREIEKW